MRDGTTTKRLLAVRLRHMLRSELPDVASTESRSFAEAWDVERLKYTLKWADVTGLVAVAGGIVIGHLIHRFDPDRLEVLRLAVDPACRGLGVGSHLLARAVADAAEHPTGTVGLYVRERNLPAQLWLRKQGWRAVGFSRGHFGDEDGIDFEFSVERW